MVGSLDDIKMNMGANQGAAVITAEEEFLKDSVVLVCDSLTAN